jgi:ribosomal protein S18 acetylase RimI-like enzyme
VADVVSKSFAKPDNVVEFPRIRSRIVELGCTLGQGHKRRIRGDELGHRRERENAGEVTVTGNDVALSGWVTSPAHHDAAITAAEGAPGVARLAERADEDRVLKLSAAMYTEEMGENPMARDPDGYRRRVRMLISRGWTYVYESAGKLQFKMDVGCASHHTAQIQGVYVPPDLRGRGVGTAAMAACCDLALDRHPNLSLYVNDFNTHAVALYERIGFRREPYDFQTIMLP